MGRRAVAKIIARAYPEYGWTLDEIEKKIENDGVASFTRVNIKYVGFGKFEVERGSRK